MWFFYSQLAAISTALRNIVVKKQKGVISTLTLGWYWLLGTVLMIVVVILIQGGSSVDLSTVASAFWGVTAVRAFLDLVGLFAYTKALQSSPVSLVFPLAAFQPVVALISSLFLNGEFPALAGYVGLGVMVLGTFLLNVPKGQKDKGAKGSRAGIPWIIFGVFCWGTNASVHKLTFTYMPALESTLIEFLLLLVVAIVILVISQRKNLRNLFVIKNPVNGFIVAFISGFSTIVTMLALSSGLNAYVTAANQLSIIYTSILGFLFFKEKLAGKIIPTGIIIVGLVIILLTSMNA